MADKHKRFSNQVAIMTGAAQGIGKACGLRFAREGANIACLDVTNDANEAVASECRRLGVDAVALPCNVTEPGSVASAIQAAVSRWGRVDTLVAAAGVYASCPLAQVEVLRPGSRALRSGSEWGAACYSVPRMVSPSGRPTTNSCLL